jgi:hypothetical protein
VSSILFIHAGDEHARDLFRREGRAYWSRVAPLALEQHGFLGFEVMTADEVEGADALERYSAILVAALPRETWAGGLADTLGAASRPVLMESPLPPEALALAPGITEQGPLRQEGAFVVGDTRLRAAGDRYGFPPTARLGPGLTRPVSRKDGLDWSLFPEVGISSEQAAAWRRLGWAANRWAVSEPARVVSEWLPDESEERLPGVVQSGRFYACSFGIFAFIGQAHTTEPFEGTTFRNCERSTGAESLLLGLIDLMHADTNAVRARVLPWPRGASWVLNVRHDFDRTLMPEQVAAVLAGHDRVGSRATWYWRARHVTGGPSEEPAAPGNDRRLPLSSVVGPLETFKARQKSTGDEAIRLVAEAPGHEVALHTELMWAGLEDEKARIERVIGQTLRGTCAHGDPNCIRFQGAPNVLWAHGQGMAYTELLSQAHFHPHRFGTLESDGTVKPLDIFCLPHHESFDRSTKPGDVNRDHVLNAATRWHDISGMLQVMNHPDQNTEELFDLLQELTAAGRLDWTADETVDWWRRTHVAENLRLERTDDGSWSLIGNEAADGVVVELLFPDGSVKRPSVDIEPGRRVPVGGDAGVRA